MLSKNFFFLLFFNSQMSMCHERVKNPLHQQNHWRSVFFLPVQQQLFFIPQWTVVHEQVFLSLPWSKPYAKSLFLVVFEQLYGIVQQHAFIPRWWTPPYSLADYLRWHQCELAALGMVKWWIGCLNLQNLKNSQMNILKWMNRIIFREKVTIWCRFVPHAEPLSKTLFSRIVQTPRFLMKMTNFHTRA